MDVQITLVPYDSGQYGQGMGRGPLRFRERGLGQALAAAGHMVDLAEVTLPDAPAPEPQAAFQLHHLIAARVGAGAAQGQFALLLSGNCNPSVGAITGLGLPDLGLIWFDAHGDFNTPETSPSGFFDGMGLAIAAGKCWQTVMAALPAFVPLPDEHIVHVAGRDFDPGEQALLDASNVAVVSAGAIQRAGMVEALAPALDALERRVQRVYLHLDLDALDPSVAPANRFAVPGGPGVDQVQAAIREIGRRFAIVGVGVASYDPAYDAEGRAADAGLHLIETVLESAQSRPR